MSKIYLAMDDSTEVVNLIRGGKKNAEIIHLKTKEEVTAALKEPFYIFVVEEKYVDLSSWPNKLEGTSQVFISSEENTTLKENSHSFIQIFKKPRDLINEIMDIVMSNFTIINEKSEKKKVDSTKEKPNPPAKEDSHTGPMINEIETMAPAQPTAEEKIETDANTKKPVTLDSYPHKDVPREKIAEEQKKMELRRAGKNKDTTTIGIWSPSGGGTTTFIISFAIYISQIIESVSVVEMPNPNRSIYAKLFRYKPHPKDWVSYFEMFKSKYSKEEDPHKWNWKYNNVMWYPIGPTDTTLKINEDEGFFHQFDDGYFNDLFENAQDNNNLVLVDFPSQLDEHAKYVLSKKIDQLWILLDESMIEEKGWHDFIHSESNGARFKTKLVFVGEGKLAKEQGTADKMAENLNVELLASVPYLDREIRNNIYYEKTPPNQNRILKKALEPVYYEIAKHLLGEEKATRITWVKQFIYDMKIRMEKMKGKFKPEVDSN